MKILVADDAKIFRKRIIKMISGIEGIEQIYEASTVAETMKVFNQFSPDIICLDLSMPDGSGIEVISALRKNGSTPVIIVLSNHSDSVYRQVCFQFGADYFLDKSTEFIKLRNIIADLNQSSLG